MASDRIGGKAAELVAVPPYEIIFTTTDRLLTEPTVAQNMDMNAMVQLAMIEQLQLMNRKMRKGESSGDDSGGERAEGTI